MLAWRASVLFSLYGVVAWEPRVAVNHSSTTSVGSIPTCSTRKVSLATARGLDSKPSGGHTQAFDSSSFRCAEPRHQKLRVLLATCIGALVALTERQGSGLQPR